MLPPSEIFHNFILPALIAAVGLAFGWGLPALFFKSARRVPWREGRWIGGLAVGAGFAAAECAIGGAPPWPPGKGDAGYWLIWFTVPVAALGLLDALFRPPTWLRAGVLFVAVRVGLRALVAPLAARADAGAAWSAETWLDGLGGAVTLWWLALERQAERMHRGVAPVVLAMVLAGAAAVFGLSDNVKPSLAAAALAAMAVAAALLAWPLKDLSLGRGAVLAFVVPLFGLLAFIHFYYDSQPPAASLRCSPPPRCSLGWPTSRDCGSFGGSNRGGGGKGGDGGGRCCGCSRSRWRSPWPSPSRLASPSGRPRGRTARRRGRRIIESSKVILLASADGTHAPLPLLSMPPRAPHAEAGVYRGPGLPPFRQDPRKRESGPSRAPNSA